MNISISLLKVHKTSPFLPPSSMIHQISLGGRSSKVRVQPQSNQRFYNILVTECSKWNSLELKPKDDCDTSSKNNEEWIKEVVLDERLREKCKCKYGEKQSMEEFMECLEREALMGEDEGKDASDYKRRAHIFNKSDRVFQALKERKTPS